MSDNSRTYSRTHSIRRQSTTKQKPKRIHNKNEIEIKLRRRTTENFTHDSYIDNKIERITSWKKSKVKTRLSLIPNILSLGLLHFFSLYNPCLYIFLYCKPAQPNTCDFFLVDDKYGHSTICESTVVYINSKDVNPKIYELINEKDNFIKMFEYCSNRYEYNHSEKLVIPLYLDLTKITNKDIKNFYSNGISDINIFKIQSKKFCLNVFDIYNLKIIEGNFFSNDLIKLSITILSIILYIIAGLYTDAAILFLLSFTYSFLIGQCIRRNYYDFEKHNFSLNKESKITYLTKRKYLQIENDNEPCIPREQIVPGDIIYLKNGDLVPCDVIILEGDCSISKSAITGKISLHRKKALEYNDEYFNYKKNNDCILLHGMKIIETQSQLINKCISALCINTGYNTFKNNQISNLYFLKIKNKNYNRFTKIFSRRRLFYYNYEFILGVASLTIFFIKYFYDKKHNLLTSNQNFWKYFGEILGICLMPIYHVTYNIIKLCSFINLSKYKIYCIDEARLLEAGNINTIFFDKTDTLSDDKIEICNFFPVYLDQTYNIHFNKNDITNIKIIRYEHLQFYKDFIIQNSLGNNNSNFTSNYNEEDLSEYKQKYRLSSLFTQILVCCVNLEKINESICGNIIEQDVIKTLKFDLNTIENSNLKNIFVNDIENKLYSAINIDPDEVRNIINNNTLTNSNINDSSSNLSNNIINEDDENKEEKDNDLFNHIFNIINTSNNITRYSSKNRKKFNNNLKDTESNADNIKSDKQSNDKLNKECYCKTKNEKTEEDKNYEIYSRNHPDKKRDLSRIREIIKKLSNDFNINLPKINKIFPINYYKNVESLKISTNLISKKNNVINPFKLVIIKKFCEQSKKRSALAISCIVYNTLDHSLRFMTKGPPDKILRYCKDTTYPNNVNEILTKLYREGNRTIALATKKIDIFRYRHWEKEEYYMNNLVFCGFVSLKSVLKKETKKVISKLKDMKCDIVINTGDSIFNSMGVGFESQVINDKNVFRFEPLKNHEILISQVYKSTKNTANFGDNVDNERSNESYSNINSNYYGENKSSKINRRQKKYIKNFNVNDGSFIINSSNKLISGERPSNISYIRGLKKSKKDVIENNIKDESLQYKKYSSANEIKRTNTDSSIIQKSNSDNTENEGPRSPPLISGKNQNMFNPFTKSDKINNAIKLNNGAISKPSKKRKNKNSLLNGSSPQSTIVECKNCFSNLSIKNENNKINIILNTNYDIKDNEITATDYSNKSGNSKIKSINNKQLQDQSAYSVHLNNNMDLSSFIYRPEMLNDPRFKHNVIFCVEGEVFNFVKSQKKKKNIYKYDKLLKFFKHFCKIFYSMSAINKSELVDYFVSLPMKNVCMVGDESNDIDAILSANVGIKIVNKNDVNSLLCHFLVDKTENNLEAIEIIIKYGIAFHENSYYLISCSIIFTTLETLLILYSLFLRQHVKGYQIFVMNIFILCFCISGFTAKPDKNIDYNNIMSNRYIFSLLKKLNICGVFIIKGIGQFVLFYSYYYNRSLADKDAPCKVFLSELFLLSYFQSISTIISYNSLSMYRKSFLNNYLFLTINYLFVNYMTCSLCLSGISFRRKVLDYLADFEYSIKNIDPFDDFAKIKLIKLCISDFIATFLYINLVKYFLGKIASNYDKKKTGIKTAVINKDKN